MRTADEQREYWTRYAARRLTGRTIASVRYLTADEARMSGWYQCGLVLTLDDGAELSLQSDDEGNGPGASYYGSPQGKHAAGVLPVIDA